MLADFEDLRGFAGAVDFQFDHASAAQAFGFHRRGVVGGQQGDELLAGLAGQRMRRVLLCLAFYDII